jgi:hypothetical protein
MAKGLNNIKDASLKTAVAQEVFGRAGTLLIPMLNDYKALGEEIQSQGGIISNEQVKNAEKFKDSMENLTTLLQTATLNSGLLESINNVIESAREAGKAIAEIEAARSKKDVTGSESQPSFLKEYFNNTLAGKAYNYLNPKDETKPVLESSYTEQEQQSLYIRKRQQAEGKNVKDKGGTIKETTSLVEDITDKARSKYIKMAEGVFKILSKEAPMQGAGLDQTVGEVKKAKGISQRVMGSNDIQTDALLNRGGNASTLQKVSQTIGQKTNTLLKKNNELLQELVIKDNSTDLTFPK